MSAKMGQMSLWSSSTWSLWYALIFSFSCRITSFYFWSSINFFFEHTAPWLRNEGCRNRGCGTTCRSLWPYLVEMIHLQFGPSLEYIPYRSQSLSCHGPIRITSAPRHHLRRSIELFLSKQVSVFVPQGVQRVPATGIDIPSLRYSHIYISKSFCSVVAFLS